MKPKLSFITGIKNRLKHLQETFPRSLEAARGFDVQFDIVDYGSTDGLSDWVSDELMEYIEAGIVNYYSVLGTGQLYMRCHAKNIATRLATSNIICNLDADNWLTHKYICKVLELFKEDDSIIIHGNKSAWGRIVLTKANLVKMQGYNEQLCYGWGYEDMDLIKRAKVMGLREITLKDKWDYKRYLAHGSDMRAAHAIEKNTSKSDELHRRLSKAQIEEHGHLANLDINWGEAKVIKNFIDQLNVGV